jgi:hypothetical protein
MTDVQQRYARAALHRPALFRCRRPKLHAARGAHLPSRSSPAVWHGQGRYRCVLRVGSRKSRRPRLGTGTECLRHQRSATELAPIGRRDKPSRDEQGRHESPARACRPRNPSVGEPWGLRGRVRGLDRGVAGSRRGMHRDAGFDSAPHWTTVRSKMSVAMRRHTVRCTYPASLIGPPHISPRLGVGVEVEGRMGGGKLCFTVKCGVHTRRIGGPLTPPPSRCASISRAHHILSRLPRGPPADQGAWQV